MDAVIIAARIVAIKKAMASGVLTVRHEDTSTTFRSLAEMKQILADLEAELDTVNGKKRRRTGYIYQYRKGL